MVYILTVGKRRIANEYSKMKPYQVRRLGNTISKVGLPGWQQHYGKKQELSQAEKGLAFSLEVLFSGHEPLVQPVLFGIFPRDTKSTHAIGRR